MSYWATKHEVPITEVTVQQTLKVIQYCSWFPLMLAEEGKKTSKILTKTSLKKKKKRRLMQQFSYVSIKCL